MCAEPGSCRVLVGLLVGSGRQLSLQFVFPQRKDGFNDVPSNQHSNCRLELPIVWVERHFYWPVRVALTGYADGVHVWIMGGCWGLCAGYVLTHLLLNGKPSTSWVCTCINTRYPTFRAGVGLDCWCLAEHEGLDQLCFGFDTRHTDSFLFSGKQCLFPSFLFFA